MKKKLVNGFALVTMITTMICSVTACGSKNEDVQDMETGTVASVTQEEAKEPAESTIADIKESTAAEVQESDMAVTEESAIADIEEDDAAADGAMTLEEWTKSEECAQFSELMNEGLDGMTISFEVAGDTISMIFTRTETIDVAEDAEEAMNMYFTSNAAIFEAIRDQLIDETGNENTVLRLIYKNFDDSEIFSMDF